MKYIAVTAKTKEEWCEVVKKALRYRTWCDAKKSIHKTFWYGYSFDTIILIQETMSYCSKGFYKEHRNSLPLLSAQEYLAMSEEEDMGTDQEIKVAPKKDRIVQIATGEDGELPGVVYHYMYGLGESGSLYVKENNDWKKVIDSPLLEE